MLYVHGNNISDFKHLSILANFSQMISFTIHGNPLESVYPAYHTYIAAIVPTLKSLNFTGLTKADRKNAEIMRTELVRKQRGTAEPE